jgi:hypothetical protein
VGGYTKLAGSKAIGALKMTTPDLIKMKIQRCTMPGRNRNRWRMRKCGIERNQVRMKQKETTKNPD